VAGIDRRAASFSAARWRIRFCQAECRSANGGKRRTHGAHSPYSLHTASMRLEMQPDDIIPAKRVILVDTT